MLYLKKKKLSFFHWSMNAILYSEHDPRVTSHQSSGRHSSVDESWCGFQPGHAQCVASGRSGVTATAAADHYANLGAGRPTDWQHSSGARLNFRGSRSNADSRRRPTNQGGRGHRTDAYNLKIRAGRSRSARRNNWHCSAGHQGGAGHSAGYQGRPGQP